MFLVKNDQSILDNYKSIKIHILLPNVVLTQFKYNEILLIKHTHRKLLMSINTRGVWGESTFDGSLSQLCEITVDSRGV